MSTPAAGLLRVSVAVRLGAVDIGAPGAVVNSATAAASSARVSDCDRPVAVGRVVDGIRSQVALDVAVRGTVEAV